jgi:hypothetical protein
MNRFAQAGALALFVTTTVLHAGCSNSSAGLITGSSNLLPSDAPSPTAMGNDNPMARPVSVAWTAARAKRCAFFFDPAKLRSNYLAYEARQGAAGDQYAKIVNTYDTTFTVTWSKVVAEADYCTDRKGLEIKADLERYLLGDYTPNLPKPKPIASCGFWGCTSSQDEKFSDRKFWDDQTKNNPKK